MKDIPHIYKHISPSTACKHILDHTYLLETWIIWILGNKQSINFWNHKWTEDSTITDKITKIWSLVNE